MIFAGAGMPLYVLSPSGDGEPQDVPGPRGTISTVKGRRKAVRNRHRKPPEEFRNREMPLNDRTFFLLTDGFVDQSGGEDGRSYGTRRLYEFLAEEGSSPGAFEREFDRYRGEEEQRDDVVAIAFSFEHSVLRNEDEGTEEE